MREIAEQSIGWLVLAGCVLAFVLGRRRGQNRFAAAVAAARAEGHAEAVSAATSQSNVNVAVDASNRGALGHQCDDLYTCAICAPIALRVLLAADRGRAGFERASIGGTARLHDDDYDYDRSTHDVAVVRTAGDGVGDNRGSGARGRGPAGDVRGSRGVEVVPCASVNESLPLSESLGTYTDMLRRPWAYDEADPRCEVRRA